MSLPDPVTVENPGAFFNALGDLHDSEITTFEWLGEVAILRVADLYGAFFGWAGYTGPTAATILFRGLSSLGVDVEPPQDTTTIYGLEVREDLDRGELDVEVSLAPGGVIRIRCLEIQGDFDPKAVISGVPKEQ